MNSSVRFCDHCGAANRFDARFCDSCGQPQQTRTPSTATGLLTASSHLKQRYHILEKLGQGGFGAVYKVEDMLFQNSVRAVKEMGMRGLNQQETQDAIAAFKNEALLLANLSHPNLPRIYDHFEEYGRWYLVMDYIEGETLQTRLDKAPAEKLPIENAVAIGLQLCAVLGYLHDHEPPIIFRDLKPDNVMLNQDDHLFLIDFGIARFFKPGQAKDTTNLGTPGYASPEQYGRMQTTIRSDIYSLGATLYHLISGINPGLHPFLFQPLDLNPQVPGNAELERLVMQMLEMKEEKRPTNAYAVQYELQHIQDLYRTQPILQVSKAAIQGTGLVDTTASSASQPSIPTNQTKILKIEQADDEAIVIPQPGQSFIVSQRGNGDYTSIGAAIQHASPGALLLVKEGIYRESLLLDKAVDIIGNGPKEQIILESNDNHCIVMNATHATIRGLTIRCLARNRHSHALDIPRGELFIEDCDITSNSSACIAVHNAAARPTIRYCTIHDGTSNGITIYDYAQGIIEYCELFQNAQPAIGIASGGNPIFRHCTIRDGQHHGIFVQEGGQGTFEDCEIATNAYAAVAVTSQGSPLLLRCQIHHNQRGGMNIYQKGKGSFQDCDIDANAPDNITIATDSTPYFYLCKIHDAARYGILVQEHGKGTIEHCEISANAAANIRIASGGDPLIQYNTISRSGHSGVQVDEDGQGTIQHCTITENTRGALNIAPQALAHVKLKRNQT